MKTEDMTFEQLCELCAYTPKNRRLTTAEAAEVLGIRPNTLEIKRSYGIGPPYLKPPGCRSVSYNERDLLSWMAQGRRNSTTDPLRARA